MWQHTERFLSRSLMGGLYLVALALPLAGASGQTMTLPGKFDVGAGGGASYSIPIVVPPGTAGMTPGLALVYSSQGDNGLVGLGWSLSGLPSIGRCSTTLAQEGTRGSLTLAATDRFCLDGQK